MCAPNSYPLVSMMPSAVAAASEHQLGRPAAEWPQLLLAWPLPQVAALIHLESALPMAADMQGRSGFFYSCCRQPEVEALQLMELLVMRGGDPRCPDRLMQTPLFPAARHGALAACRWLLHHGVPADARDCFGQTAAYEAARLGQTAVLRLLTAAGMATDAGGPLPMPRPPVGTSALEASMAHLRGIGSVMSQGVAQGVHGQGERGGIRDESMLEPRTVASTHTALPGPLSHTPALVNSADVPSGRKRYRLQYLGTAGQWLYANADKLQEFELRFPELCPWNCRQPPARIPKVGLLPLMSTLCSYAFPPPYPPAATCYCLRPTNFHTLPRCRAPAAPPPTRYKPLHAIQLSDAKVTKFVPQAGIAFRFLYCLPVVLVLAMMPQHDVFKKLWMPLARKMLRRVRASVPLEGQLTSTLSAVCLGGVLPILRFVGCRATEGTDRSQLLLVSKWADCCLGRFPRNFEVFERQLEVTNELLSIWDASSIHYSSWLSFLLLQCWCLVDRFIFRRLAQFVAWRFALPLGLHVLVHATSSV
eukprot:GHVT01005898.1.p1 GENE.GHVT01005898.1~~GHVT01005898.1.p1  ORF type:complete len:533 (+),score=49.50 GHVT01005898.1:472-2070(+)